MYFKMKHAFTLTFFVNYAAGGVVGWVVILLELTDGYCHMHPTYQLLIPTFVGLSLNKLV
jgi:hypothetical protein